MLGHGQPFFVEIFIYYLNSIFMKIIWLNLSFANYSDSLLETKVQAIYAAMNGNAHFANPTPALPDVDAAIKAYSAALVAASSGDRYLIAEKNKVRKALVVILRQLGKYVMMAAGDDKEILITSGFDVRKDPESSALETPQIVSVATGKNPGEVVVKVNGTTANSFIYECTADPLTDASEYEQVVSTRKTQLIEGLKPVSKMWFRVTAVGPRGATATSAAVSYVVQ